MADLSGRVPPNQPEPGKGGIYMVDLSDWYPDETNPLAGARLLEPYMHVNMHVTPAVIFGNTCKAVQRLPVIRTLQRMANETSCVIESFA
jgi:hypothetical protein